MQTVHRINEVRAQVREWKLAGQVVGFVPTMGNLHAGHISLIETAHQHADKVVASVFVNPTQFGPGEDFDSYPRTLEADQEKLAAAGTDLLFAPPAEEMYPRPNQTWVTVDRLGDHLCGANRPGHFRGVTTVVSKLFNIVQPDVACFGEKDYQQLAIIRRMVEDLFFPVTIISVPTAREQSGLALSSRNGYLGDSERSQAARLQSLLKQVKAQILAGQRDYPALCNSAIMELQQHGFVVDYFAVMNADTLSPATASDNRLLLAVAAHLGQTRLIDNIPFNIV